MRSSSFVPFVIAVSLCVPNQLSAQDHQHGTGTPPQKLGTVRFANSCSAAVQEEFNRGVALLHSFWFSAALDTFNKVLAKDPGCAMAHWGIAMSWWGNPFGVFRSQKALASGGAAVDKARAAAPKTPPPCTYQESRP